MLTNTAAVRSYFAKLGFEKEIADLYLALHTHGPQNISELSRTSKVERTRIYRLIDTLLKSNLIEVETHYKRGVIKAAPIANLHILITQKEQELKSLQDELELIQQVLARNSLSNPASQVQFYHGPEGVRQMLWNVLKAKSEIVGYTYRILDEITGRTFMERWAVSFKERDLRMRLLLSDEFAKSWYENKPKVVQRRRVTGITYNLIDAQNFEITHSCKVYDNTIAYFNWKDNEVFGIEIYNKDIAAAWRHFLNALLIKSKPETRF
ncbi:MAG TPA: helix-turn-helix domain-containing protein [Candidatus Saccharimonadales bacterium]|nr:helix-turn-helix domain-containing protein [Candidatus Saccharimonadales bacterium]